ncbi:MULTISPECIES: LpxI family protein [Thalassospira]|uniref:UDP-2,3-diacylglucosamine diphosphatase LpxI n=1 Tax=Thalassospira povalilytica TaxID=732237 RepID=A0A8I1M9E9_9PROT|nr:UDP-2,3-diacylglucosamine diphosphatase LpxI [Thalassospira povalilytica]MBN8197459.1 UDP-2,3-diacylglucosamine diphosphatase LpxI [Thalassospira povalilytica]
MTAPQDNPLPKLGIIAGGGALPARLASAAQTAGRAVFVVKLDRHADDPQLDQYPGITARLGAAAKILDAMRDNACQDVVLAGKVARPSFTAIRPDWRAAKLLMKVGMKALGDDGLLRLVGQELEREGFRLVGAHEILTDLAVSEGVLGTIKPDDQALSDARHGLRVARILGQADVGQGCVVQQGLVLALEAIEGTDEMVRRSANYRRDGVGGVLVKSSKPQQDKRLDLPAIGLTTVEEAHKAGLRGIALLAGGTMIIDRSAVIERADRLGMFVIGIRPDNDGDPEND